MADEDQLQKSWQAAITRDTRINPDRCDLRMTVDDGSAVLHGTVNTVAAKRIACALALQLDKANQISDRILVKRPEKMGDRELVDHIRKAFIQDGNIELERVQIEADREGRVALEGKVHSLMQQRLCEVLCWWVPGVAAVDNRLAVEPAEEDNDAELRDNLLVILSKDRLIQPETFKLLVRDGTVSLEGMAGSEAEKKAVENDCWYCPGVKEVENRLRVG